MEQIKIESVQLFRGVKGGLQLSLMLTEQQAEKIQNAVEKASERLKNGKDVGITIDGLKKKRSLDANAYFHVLCDKIAAVLKITLDEVKDEMVESYGTPLYQVIIPSDADIRKFWRYSKYIGEVDGQDSYLLFKATHTLDSGEMARLIDGTIKEAKQLGIETATPEELRKMQEQWERYYEKKRD